jgi:hypothetical protein
VATADSAAGYGLDNAWRNALARLRSLEDWLDPGLPGSRFAFMSQVTMAAWGRRP